VQAETSSGTDGNTIGMGFNFSGATAIAASDPLSLLTSSGASNAGCATVIIAGLTPGTNTFTAKYIPKTSTGQWSNRYIAVIPMP
jgi:hypothetical protein